MESSYLKSVNLCNQSLHTRVPIYPSNKCPLQGFYPLPYSNAVGSGGVSTAGFIGAQPTALLSWVRAQGPHMVQPSPHQPQLPPPPTSQPQQQVFFCVCVFVSVSRLFFVLKFMENLVVFKAYMMVC